MWLTEMDLQLTNVEHFSESDADDKMRQLDVRAASSAPPQTRTCAEDSSHVPVPTDSQGADSRGPLAVPPVKASWEQSP